MNSIAEAIRNGLTNGKPAVLVTVIQSEEFAVGAKLLIIDGGEIIGDLGNRPLNDAIAAEGANFLRVRDEAKASTLSEFAPELQTFSDTRVLFERVEAEPRLVIAGAGHVGAALARLAALVAYQVTLIDDRAEFVARELFAGDSEQGIRLIAAEDWAKAMQAAVGNGRGVSVAIVTRGHKQDEECLRAAAASRPDYIGMIGSKRRTNIVLEKLAGEGFDQDALNKVRAPIGLDIGAVTPEEVALAILAEIVAMRRGGSGSPLSAWRRI